MTEKRVSYFRHMMDRSPGGLERWRASQAVCQAVRAGKMVRPDRCARCGKKGRIQGHHADYSKPLEVEWVCTKCHGAEHRKLRNDADAARRARLRDPAHSIRARLNGMTTDAKCDIA
jgi:hypothetical protein